MFRHKMQTCVFFLGLVMLAGARVGRPLPPDETWSSECDCEELRLQIKHFLRLQEENITKELLEAMQLQEQEAERRAQEALRLQERTATALTEAVRLQVEATLRLYEQRVSTALTEAVLPQVESTLRLYEQRASTALTEAVLPQVEETLRLYEQRASTALTEAVRLQVEESLLGKGVLEKTCEDLVPLSTPEAPPATASSFTSLSPSASTFPSSASSSPSSTSPSITSRSPSASASERPPAVPAPPPTSAPSAFGSSGAEGAAANAGDVPASGLGGHDQQTERRRVQARVEETRARWERTREQPSPLGEALRRAAVNGSLHDVQCLIDEGADVNYASSVAGRSPLLAVACSDAPSSDVVSLLLKRGAEVNAIDVNGWSALHCATRHENLASLSLLLGAGADVDTRALYGETPLHWAAYYDKEAAVRALLAGGASKDLKGWTSVLDGKTPFDRAKSDAVRDLLRPCKCFACNGATRISD